MPAVSPRVLAFVAGGVMTATSAVVATYEGYVPQAYKDVVGVTTACYGHTGSDVKMGQTYTKAECTKFLTEDLYEAAAAVEQCAKRPLTNNQKAATISLAYNIGGNAFCGSTLVKRLNAGEPAAQWCPEFKKWTYANGIQWKGLVKRRQEEFLLCLKPDTTLTVE